MFYSVRATRNFDDNCDIYTKDSVLLIDIKNSLNETHYFKLMTSGVQTLTDVTNKVEHAFESILNKEPNCEGIKFPLDLNDTLFRIFKAERKGRFVIPAKVEVYCRGKGSLQFYEDYVVTEEYEDDEYDD